MPWRPSFRFVDVAVAEIDLCRVFLEYEVGCCRRGSLLRERAKLVHTGENAAIAGPLRSATVGLLGRFRDALRDEIEEAGSVVPQTHEAVLFAYIDQLAAQRAHATTTQPSVATPETRTESNTPM